MELELSYILSQIFTIITYVLLAITYYAKDRKTVLSLSFLSIITNSLEYVFLNAYSGMAMCILALIRNIIFLIDEKKNGKREKNNAKDICILVVLYIIAVIFAIFTYEGFFSLLSVFATVIYTYSVWQKKTKIYKLCGIPIGVLWILYNAYVKSIFGIILEAVLLICSITGYIIEVKEKKVKDSKQ